MTLTRRKKFLFAVAAMTLSFVGMLVLLLVADLILHQRAERSAGLNRYGYRGPVIGKKQPGELRVAMLGGSTVFGYGVAWNESIAAFLEPKLEARLGRPVSVVNLGYNNEGAFSFVPNLEDFEYLDYDVIVLYEGYNDLTGDDGPNRSVYRRDSAIFRAVGYFPILPLYLDEKAKSLRFGGVAAAYDELKPIEERQQPQVVFRPGIVQRTSAAALEALSSMTLALDGQFDKTGAVPPATKESESALGCAFPFVTYCESVAAAVRYGLSRGKAVVVGSQPRVPGSGRARERHARQQETLGAMIGRVFGHEPRVAWADVSTLIDLSDPQMTADAMHLSPPANAKVADGLVEPIVSAVAGAGIK